MSGEARKAAGREKSKTYRERMRAKGYRLVQRWVPDTRTEAFRETARKESLAIARSEHEAEDQAFVDAISVSWDDEAR